MQEEDLEPPKLEPRAQPHQAAIKVTDGTFSWSINGEAALKDVNLEVLEGQLLMVVGEVGSGKSSLLSALLGEMKVQAGHASVKGNSLKPCGRNHNHLLQSKQSGSIRCFSRPVPYATARS